MTRKSIILLGRHYGMSADSVLSDLITMGTATGRLPPKPPEPQSVPPTEPQPEPEIAQVWMDDADYATIEARLLALGVEPNEEVIYSWGTIDPAIHVINNTPRPVTISTRLTDEPRAIRHKDRHRDKSITPRAQAKGYRK